jgi:hypothetical protein
MRMNIFGFQMAVKNFLKTNMINFLNYALILRRSVVYYTLLIRCIITFVSLKHFSLCSSCFKHPHVIIKRLIKVIYNLIIYCHYPNNAHTNQILKPDTISKWFKKKNVSIIKYKCYRKNWILYTTIKFNRALEDEIKCYRLV